MKSPKSKFTYETKRKCPRANCGRNVDAVRTKELDGLRLSRHLLPSNSELCPNSLAEVVEPERTSA